MTMYKTVAVPDRGIDYSLKPHAFDPRAWFILDGWRTKNGTIRSFEGWNSIMAPPLGEPVLGLAEYMRPIDLARFYMVMAANTVHSYDIAAGTRSDITGGMVLAASPTRPWASAVFGGSIHIASLNTDGIHFWDGTAANLVKIDESPSFAHINTINNYLVGVYERLGTEHYPYSFRWAAEGTNDQWIATETIDAGEFDISDTPDKCVALHRLGDDLVVYKERTIVPVTFVGGNEVFGRRAAVAGTGLIGPYALAMAGDRHIFMGQENFYSYTGGNVVDDSVGDMIRDKVYPELNKTTANQSRAIYLRDRLEMVYFYPSLDNVDDVGCDKAVIYNLKDGTWTGPMTITDFITFVSNFDHPDPLKRDILGSVAGKVMAHGTSFTEDGLAQTRVMESGDHNMQTDLVDADGAKLFFPLTTVFQVNVVNIDVESVSGAPTARFFIGSRLDLNDDISWQGPLTITATSAQTIVVPVRRTGRWFRIKIECDANLPFVLLGYQFECERVGMR